MPRPSGTLPPETVLPRRRLLRGLLGLGLLLPGCAAGSPTPSPAPPALPPLAPATATPPPAILQRPEPGPPVALEFWTTGLAAARDWLAGVAVTYTRAQPTVRVQWRDLPPDRALDTVTVALAAGQGPAVLHTPDLAALVPADGLRPLNALFPPADLAAFWPRFQAAWTLEGVVWALPWFAALDLVVLNPRLWEAAPPAPGRLFPWSALRALARDWHRREGRPALIAPLGEGALLDRLDEEGFALFLPTGQPALDQTAVLELVQTWENDLRQGVVLSHEQAGRAEGRAALFGQGRVPWALLPAAALVRPDRGDRPVADPRLYPPVAGQRGPVAALAPVALTRLAPAAAAAFLGYLTGPDLQAEWVALTGWLPTRPLTVLPTAGALPGQAVALAMAVLPESGVASRTALPVRSWARLLAHFVQVERQWLAGQIGAVDLLRQVSVGWRQILGQRVAVARSPLL